MQCPGLQLENGLPNKKNLVAPPPPPPSQKNKIKFKKTLVLVEGQFMLHHMIV